MISTDENQKEIIMDFEDQFKNYKKLYIRGNYSQPDKVIEVLEDAGGFNSRNYACDNPANIYIIGTDDSIVKIDDWWLQDIIATHPDWTELKIKE